MHCSKGRLTVLMSFREERQEDNEIVVNSAFWKYFL